MMDDLQGFKLINLSYCFLHNILASKCAFDKSHGKFVEWK